MRNVLLSFTLLIAACGDDDNNSHNPTPDMAMGMMQNDCPTPTGAGVDHHGILTTDETWTAAESPHLVSADLDIRGGATVTIEPCAVVRVATGSSITVGSGTPSDGTGTLVAHGTFDGTTTRPVVFTADDQSAYWGSLLVNATGTADLEVVGIDRGGAPSAQGGAALAIRGDDNRAASIRNVRAVAVLVQSSATLGLSVRGSGGFTADSTQLGLTGGGAMGSVSAGVDSHYAAYVEAPGVGTIPDGDYTGNAKDEILIRTPFVLDADETLPSRGVPYQVVYSWDQSSPGAGLRTLTIEAGVTVKLGGPLYTNPHIRLGGSSGAAQVRLVAAGTATAPITITSAAAAPTAGDWAGIDWGGGPPSGNVMTYVTVSYGGGDLTANGFGCGPADTDALLMITSWRPNDAFIQSCTFSNSLAGGIVSGWDSSSSGPNLKTGNTFNAIGNGCEVSQPADQNHMCPSNRVTPDCY